VLKKAGLLKNKKNNIPPFHFRSIFRCALSGGPGGGGWTDHHQQESGDDPGIRLSIDRYIAGRKGCGKSQPGRFGELRIREKIISGAWQILSKDILNFN
jgi:hypothetical protein